MSTMKWVTMLKCAAGAHKVWRGTSPHPANVDVSPPLHCYAWTT